MGTKNPRDRKVRKDIFFPWSFLIFFKRLSRNGFAWVAKLATPYPKYPQVRPQHKISEVANSSDTMIPLANYQNQPTKKTIYPNVPKQKPSSLEPFGENDYIECRKVWHLNHPLLMAMVPQHGLPSPIIEDRSRWGSALLTFFLV